MTACINLQNLRKVINEEDWNQLLEDVKPKYFINTKSDYKQKSHTLENAESDKYSKNLYDELAENDLNEHERSCDYPHNSYFPYDGVIRWTVDNIIACDKFTDCLIDNKLDMLRLSIQFLCNFFTYALPNAVSMDDDVPRYLDSDDLKQTILNTTSSRHRPLANAACIYVHNALKKLHYDYFMHDQKILYQKLLKPTKEGFTSAKDALLCLLRRPNVFEDVYSSIGVDGKLDLLEVIYNELWESWETNDDVTFTQDQAEFLALTFCERSDLILKTVDTYVNSVEPREVILTLDILGLLTSLKYKILTNAKRLLINCKYLLMSLHMMGKDSNNFFTPITNLSEVAPNDQGRTVNVSSTNDAETFETLTAQYDPQDHPAFGFKAGLIQVIANMVYKDRTCQDLFREIDGIPLLLDCCNIDARNPLIPQWTILALRNLCEGNLENQEIIRNCKKEGVLDNPVLQEMGLTLHEDEDGKSIRIAPLRRN
ncbi:hypothetical protein DMN91_004244 [Ooceraea biroi]|uniref:Ataxin-10 n=1 Tax=Ooceraea biroi TaxID=2015173 RepID=A0A3L8DU86_OOCBI|nr:hypothetical protein DMN91_004244 [Ooceraea biroi]